MKYLSSGKHSGMERKGRFQLLDDNSYIEFSQDIFTLPPAFADLFTMMAFKAKTTLRDLCFKGNLFMKAIIIHASSPRAEGISK